MKAILSQLISSPVGAFVVLAVAAFLEIFGDACFQSRLYRSSGATHGLRFLAGTLVLSTYGLFVNLPQWDFGKLLGVYVALFFVMAQVVAKVRFHQSPSTPILAGGALSFYFGTYLVSAMEGGNKGALSTVRYAEKTASGRKPEMLLPGDAVAAKGIQRLTLSPKAVAEDGRE